MCLRMGRRSDDDRARYSEYREICERELLGPSLQGAVLVLFLLQNLVFIPADYLIHPEHFADFLVARLLLNAALGVIYFGMAARYPVFSTWLVCGLGGVLFLYMLSKTGGASSGYYVGLILLVIGLGVLTPVNWRQGAGISGMLFAGYAALPTYVPGPTDVGQFSQHLFFFGAACLESVFACGYMDRMRFSDFKQKRELEEARDELAELDRAKSRFSANIHHELRTPLTLILAPLEAMRSGEFGEIPESMHATLATMQANGRRLHKMINNLLDLAKLESRDFSIARGPLQIAPMVEGLIQGALGLAERKQVSLDARGFAALPEINADADAIEKVLVNLLGNALKFTNPGGQILLTGARHGDGVRIEVRDDGIGIDAEHLDSIFDRFAQIDGSATRRYEGTGIGLSLAREVVDLHGGEIRAESAGEGQGTTMIVTLPRGEADADATAEPVLADGEGATRDLADSIRAVEADLGLEVREQVAAPAASEAQRAEAVARDESDPSASVLVVEDNPDMRSLLTRLISREFDVDEARNGREALERMAIARPDLVLSDVMMPEMSGLELCSRIKSDEETRDIPVVLVTSKAEHEMKIEGLELGADDYVTKPFHPRELLARVRAQVRVRGLQRALADRNRALERALEDLKAAEVQLVHSERLAAVGELAAGIAHEVNNPVNFALNAARAMDASLMEIDAVLEAIAPTGELREKIESELAECTDTLRELAGIVGEGLGRTHSLVGDLRDFAAPGRRPGTRGPIDLRKSVSSTLALLGHGLGELDARVSFDATGPPAMIEGDRAAVGQVLLNLIKNAAEAMVGHGGEITILIETGDSEVRLSVRDQGPGFEDADRARLFEPFFTTKESGRGTGLGLSISHQIVHEHGGRIEVESRPGEGACFTIVLPQTRTH